MDLTIESESKMG